MKRKLFEQSWHLGKRFAGRVKDLDRQSLTAVLLFEPLDDPESIFVLCDGPEAFQRVEVGASGSIELRPGGLLGTHWHFLKSWPDDAVMIVAANAGEEVPTPGAFPVSALCRTCGQRLIASSLTVQSAMGSPLRLGRPVKFFCIPCAIEHDPKSIDALKDDRRPARRRDPLQPGSGRDN